MYRATLIFSYSFSLSGYYTYFWYPIPLSQLRLGYFLHFSASIPFFPLCPGISYPFRPPYPSCRCARVFPALFGLYTLFPAAPWVFPALFGLYTLFPAAPWVFPILFGLYTLFPAAPGYFPAFLALYTLAILRFCVCCSLTIHRIAWENVFRNPFFDFLGFLCKIA